ncbi:LacI family DNA-binding transcriptional regulator [Limnohabitans lacus]|jgi:LacI family transcriptional regulator|uniref:Substrate-binding domain-containing protein n=1 Tax=Limnohabitans lacus TaxID=3045173 RepID=A0ABT6X6Z3_9BURK|nr:substrate-binding domain-containing protein [Limnohabitans sp. HM2-2]MDI9233836.1 substrate-binding domain-containing protein [Limnohabitans sp. HM2-2]
MLKQPASAANGSTAAPSQGAEVQPLYKGRATLGMVAQRAGVSPSTVSRILNGTAKVSEDKQTLVRQVIEELGFRPDPTARSLAGGRTMSIGVLTQYIDSPFYGEALRGIEDVLHQAEYAPLFVSGHWNQEEERSRLGLLQDRKVDGIIVLTGKLADQTLVDMANQLPVVVTGRQLSAPNLFSIDFDNIEGAGLAVKHLHALGHQNVAFISGPLDHPDAEQRLMGYRAELARRDMPSDDALVVYSDFQESGGFRAMNQLLESRVNFSAVIAANDQMAYGARLALHRAGLRVPDDISLVGFDDLPHSAFTLPPLTTVRQSVYEIGASAAKAMIDLLSKKTPSTILIEAEIIVRESSRIFRR